MKLNEVFTFRILRNYLVKIIVALTLSAAFYSFVLNKFEQWIASDFAQFVPSEFGQLRWQSTQQDIGLCIIIAWDLRDDWRWQDGMEKTAIFPRAQKPVIRYSPWQAFANANDETVALMNWGARCVQKQETETQHNLLSDFGTGKGMYIRERDFVLYISSDKRHLYYLGVDI